MQSLLTDVSELFHLLHSRKVNYLLVGGIALLQYIEGRHTKDIDLIVAFQDLERLPEIEIKTHDDDFAQGYYKNLPVDFYLTRNLLFQKVKRHYATMDASSPAFLIAAIPTVTRSPSARITAKHGRNKFRSTSIPQGKTSFFVMSISAILRPWNWRRLPF